MLFIRSNYFLCRKWLTMRSDNSQIFPKIDIYKVSRGFSVTPYNQPPVLQTNFNKWNFIYLINRDTILGFEFIRGNFFVYVDGNIFSQHPWAHYRVFHVVSTHQNNILNQFISFYHPFFFYQTCPVLGAGASSSQMCPD